MQLFIDLMDESSCLCSAELPAGPSALRGSGLSSTGDCVFKWRGKGGGGGGGGRGGGGGGGEAGETANSSLSFCCFDLSAVTKIWTGISAGIFSCGASDALVSTISKLFGCSGSGLVLNEGRGHGTAARWVKLRGNLGLRGCGRDVFSTT